MVYPRLIAGEHGEDFPNKHLCSNLPALDAMFAGGIERGSSTLILGPAGVGKLPSRCNMLTLPQGAERWPFYILSMRH